MRKKMTITLDEKVYEGLHKRVGKRNISRYIEELVKPHVLVSSLDDGYKAMAEDIEREKEAMEWCNAIAEDMADEAR